MLGGEYQLSDYNYSEAHTRAVPLNRGHLLTLFLVVKFCKYLLPFNVSKIDA